MATTDKLNKLKQTKADFKVLLIEKGQTPGDVFSEYPDMFRAIEGGGGEQATPEIAVSDSGLITATAGDKSATKQLSTQSGKTITPGPTEQIAVAAGKYVTGNIIVAAVQSGGGGDGSAFIITGPEVSIASEVSVIVEEYNVPPTYTSACFIPSGGTGTTLTGTITAKAGDWVLATVTTRADATYPADWTLLHESDYVTESSDGTKQKMAFLCKQIDVAGAVNCTVNQASTARIYLNLIAVSNCNGFVYHGDGEIKRSSGSFAVTKPDCPYVIWGCTSIYGGAWACNEISKSVIHYSADSNGYRQANFWDADAVGSRTFKPDTSGWCIVDYVEVID